MKMENMEDVLDMIAEKLVGEWTTVKKELSETVKETLEALGIDAEVEDFGEFIGISSDEMAVRVSVENAGSTWYLGTVY